MGEIRMFRRIGRKVRDDSKDIVEAGLPDRFRILLDRLTSIEEPHTRLNGPAAG